MSVCVVCVSFCISLYFTVRRGHRSQGAATTLLWSGCPRGQVGDLEAKTPPLSQRQQSRIRLKIAENTQITNVWCVLIHAFNQTGKFVTQDGGGTHRCSFLLCRWWWSVMAVHMVVSEWGTAVVCTARVKCEQCNNSRQPLTAIIRPHPSSIISLHRRLHAPLHPPSLLL